LESDHAPTPSYTVDDASIIYDGRRLPKGYAGADGTLAAGVARGVREVVTERSLLNAGGTIFELPRGNLDGMRAITTHNREIYDFMSWRGMLVVSGNLTDAPEDGNYFKSDDGQAGLWFGNVDDLWSFGTPTGVGGPWLNESVSAGEESDPYLMAGYDRKLLELSHDSDEAVDFTVLIDFQANLDKFYEYERFTVDAGETFSYLFPEGFDAQWIKFKSHSATTATAWLTYSRGLLPGDADNDGDVDFADAWVLLDNYKSGEQNRFWADGDFNGDGVVDDADAAILLNAYAASGTSEATEAADMLIEATHVPEPATMVVLAMGGLVLIRRRT
jgi:hypothetical protein